MTDIDEEQQFLVPQWHKTILDERQEKLQQGKASFLGWEVAKKDIQETIGQQFCF